VATPITLSGFNNIDFKAIVDIIIKSEHQPIDRVQAQQQAEQDRLAAFTKLGTTLSSLKSAFAALNSPAAYGSLQAASSDEATLTATASAAASKGTFTIDVVSLARPQVTASAARQFNDINADVISGGSFSITQNGTTTNLDLTGVTTLAQLRAAINTQQSGVKASLVNDGSSADTPAKPFRLVLTSAASGVAGAFTVNDQTAGSALNLSTDATNGVAVDTEFKYNGLTVKSASTEVSGAVPGLTLNLLKTGTAIVSVTDDNSVLKEKITAAVTAFNNFNDFFGEQSKLPATGADRPPLSTDPVLRGLNRQIRSYLTSSQPNSGTIQNLAGLGITLNRSGKLEIDDGALDQALSENAPAVQTFLSGVSGFAAKVGNYVASFSDVGGSLTGTETRIQKTIDSYTERVTTLEARLALRQDQLTKQFTAADQAISQLNSQANALSGLGGQYRLF
jgi:flagellar hook-associated protein 2